MPRVVELIEDIEEQISRDALDLKTRPKTIKAGAIGVVRSVIVPGHSIYVDFGRGIGTIAVSERVVKDVPSDAGELVEYLRTRHKVTR